MPLSSRPVVSAQCDASSSGSTGANDFIDTAESSEGNEFIQIAGFMYVTGKVVLTGQLLHL